METRINNIPPHRSQRGTQKKETPLSKGEKRQLRQLLFALMVFGLLLIGKATPTGYLYTFGAEMTKLLHWEQDFVETFSALGKSIGSEEPFLDTFSGIFDSTSPGEEETTEDTDAESLGGFGDDTEEDGAVSQVFYALPEVLESTNIVTSKLAEESSEIYQTFLETGNYTSPIVGGLSSTFGYRTHPISGEYLMHEGVDLVAEEGREILAFADGIVDYVGESEVYGLYLQLEHGDGYETFYAHCSALLVTDGASVSKGDVIALVGETGEVTGAHLHFELKENGERIDPLPYVETVSQ